MRNKVWTSVAWSAAAILWFGLAAGCGQPRAMLVNPPQWPAELAGRKLYNTPSAYIYAGSREAAREVEEVVSTADADFRQRTGLEPVKGLIVATDATETLNAFDVPALVQVFHERKIETRKRPHTFDVELVSEQELVDMGIREEQLLYVVSLSLPPERAADILKLPEDVVRGVPWVICMPTYAAIAKGNAVLMNVALDARGMGTLVRIAISPLTAMIRSTGSKMAATGRGLSVFEMNLKAQGSLSLEQRNKFMQDYEQEKMEKAAGMFQGMMKDLDSHKKQRSEANPPQPAGN